MTATAKRPVNGRAGLLEKLLAAVRVEFRTEIHRPAPEDPVFVSAVCTVADCGRLVHQRGLCNGHAIRWRQRGRPPVEDFLADPGRRVRGRTLPGCSVEGCNYGANGRGLCSRHRDRWVRARRPDPGDWDAPPLAADQVPAECRLPLCTLWVESQQKILCKNHEDRWRRAGQPEIEVFAVDCELTGRASIDLRGPAPQLTLEFQYGLRCRADARHRTTPPDTVMQAVRLTKATGVTSLLDLDETQWREGAKAQKVRDPVLFLIEARDAVETLGEGAGWEVEYPRDVWRLHELPGISTPATSTVPRPRVRLRFDRITLGLLLAVMVTAASVTDQDAGQTLLARLQKRHWCITLGRADGGYTGRLVDLPRDILAIALTVVKRSDDTTGFVVLPKRWLVERTFAWLMHSRHLARDYETRTDTSKAMVRWSMTMVMNRRLARRPA